jgi:hypothetical protein
MSSMSSGIHGYHPEQAARVAGLNRVYQAIIEAVEGVCDVASN